MRGDGGEIVPGPLRSDALIPPWLRSLTGNVDGVSDSVNSRGDRTRLLTLPRRRGTRSAAVLVLFGGPFESGENGAPPIDAEVLLIQRATTLRNHPGQVAFPGGALDPGDDYPVGTALREAQEETGLDPDGVVPLAQLRSFPLQLSGFDVVPVIGYSPTPSPVRVVDQGETARVARVPLRDLLSADNRFLVQRSVMGGRVYRGPAFWVQDMLVWGFTGGLLAAIFETAGWDLPWNTADVRDLGDMLERAGQG